MTTARIRTNYQTKCAHFSYSPYNHNDFTVDINRSDTIITLINRIKEKSKYNQGEFNKNYYLRVGDGGSFHGPNIETQNGLVSYYDKYFKNNVLEIEVAQGGPSIEERIQRLEANARLGY